MAETPQTMRALAIEDGKPVLQETRAVPELVSGPNSGGGEALIRPTRMGVCSTDLELCKGYMGFAGVLGHEFVGVVEAVANRDDEGWIGKRVVGEINAVCGVCDMCKAGLRSHCRNRTVLGILNRDGCFADRFTLPVLNLHEVPESVDDDHAVFTEPLAAALQVVRQLKIEGRPYVTVLGDGRLGLLCAQVLAKLNATVRVVGKHEAKLRLCEKWGIPARPLGEVGLRKDQDIVVDATGSPTGLTTAIQMVRPRGTIVLKTTVAPPSAGSDAPNPADLAPIVIDEITVLGSRCGPFRDALQTLAKRDVDVSSLITKRMKLADGVDVLRAANQPGVMKVLLEP
ncbi:MAG: alcohol dehydrogenase catalytic domain-containing protein [Planctomycetota bacterium]